MIIILVLIIAISVFLIIRAEKLKKIEEEYKALETEVLEELGFSSWYVITYFDVYLTVKSRQSLEKYDAIKFLKEDRERLTSVQSCLNWKIEVKDILEDFLINNKFKEHPQYVRIEQKIKELISRTKAFRINVKYISSAGNVLGEKEISLCQSDINRFLNNPELLMSKSEHNKYIKAQQKEALEQKHHEYYEKVNDIIDFANGQRENLFIKGSQEQVDDLISRLFDRTINSIKKIKTIDSEEWDIIGNFIKQIDQEIRMIVTKNQNILDYYQSLDFLKLKETCETLMKSQREFNQYIIEKVEAVSKLFGTRIVRNETINEDEYQYIRPYKKSITPFTAEVSATVFASAENSPLEYIVKNFYPNKKAYPEQIQKLHLLIEELETLKDAKRIIDNYKLEYQQYLGNVPADVLQFDESGFYSRLGFANVDDSVLSVEYKFAYTSGGGMAKRTFTVPMTEETIVELIKTLENKLTATAFTKEQRALMTKKLREAIKVRDNFTCCNCGNSIHSEPNLLLEIDHIKPVSKGGYTVEENLQTLCWKCNRAKSNKITDGVVQI